MPKTSLPTHGILTSDTALALAAQVSVQGYDVLCGHGQAGPATSKSLGKLHTWYGSTLSQTSMLADLDIAVVERGSDRAVLLAEIEETTVRPKVLIGDAVTVLLGSGVSFQGRQLRIGQWTTLVVAARLAGPSHAGRLSFLRQQVSGLKEKLDTPNACVGRVVLTSYMDAGDLERTLTGYVQAATG